MKPAKEIRALLKHAGLHTSAARDKSVLADALRAAGLNRDSRLARHEPSIWRTIMKSRTTKLASAAVIVAAIIISLSQFHQPVVKAVEISEMTQAMQEVPWMHLSAHTQGGPVTGRIEFWIGFAAKVQAGTTPDGKVTFSRFKEHEEAEYDPNSRTITLSYVREDEFSPLMSSPVQMVESMYKMLKEKGAEIVTKTGDYRGRKVQIQEISLSMPEQGIHRYAMKLYIDPQFKLLQGYEVTGVNASGTVVASAECACDYPPTGPRDIYDLGVPRNTRVVDNQPSNDLQAILQKYQQVRTEAMREYIVVIAHHQNLLLDANMIFTVDVEYKSDRKFRRETHSVFSGDNESWTQSWPRHRQELGDSFESLLAWSWKHRDDPRGDVRIELADGQNECLTRRFASAWRKEPVRRSIVAKDDLALLANRAWPNIPGAMRIIDDDFARQRHLICIEGLTQGVVIRNVGLVSQVGLPARWLYYLDPSLNYLCTRQSVESCPDAAWQQDKNWLAGVDPNKVPNGSITMYEITDTFKAPNGYWYPKTVVEKRTGPSQDYKTVPLKAEAIMTVHLATSPTFPESIFDIDKLPGPATGADLKGETSAAGESKVVPFEEAKDQALAVIKKREVWPESPEAVCNAFWAARTKRNYAEMHILWPGSASYDWAELLRKDDPKVEYVFGEAGADGTEVPYAAKSYFEKNHKYNLTMRLKKLDTDKGPRYYIISGN